jgi:outer membrane murein-binding lipoprotein Lpp
MRALLNGASRRDGFGAHMDEFRTEIRTLNKTIEQLAATVATLKTDNNR